MKRIILWLTFLLALSVVPSYAKAPKLGLFAPSTPCIRFNLTFGVNGIVRLAGHTIGGAKVGVYSADWSELCYETETIKGGVNDGKFVFPIYSFYSDIFNENYCWDIRFRTAYYFHDCELMYDPGPPDHMLPMQFSLS